jgi:hypothetical protein
MMNDFLVRIKRLLSGGKNGAAKATFRSSISARVIRADGTVEDKGVIFDSEKDVKQNVR